MNIAPVRRVLSTVTALGAVVLLTFPANVASAQHADRAAATAARTCTVSVKLVPSCGLWWGVSPGMWQDRLQGTHAFEQQMGARVDVYKTYHFNGDLFPSPTERRIARQPGHHRILNVDYVPDGNGLSWADVASGQDDSKLVEEANYLRTFHHRLFVSVHHEPENEVIESPGSGYQASDFAAMFRHVVQVFRAHGVHNVVWVWNIMGDQGADSASWFNDLYPGNHYVDWIGADIYGCFSMKICHDFARSSMNQRFGPHASWPGFYRWSTHRFPHKPIMLSEWAAFSKSEIPEADRVQYLKTVRHQLSRFPRLKAICYWDSNRSTRGDPHLVAGTRASQVVSHLAQSYHFRQWVH